MGFFVPTRLEQKHNSTKNGKQIAFYWIKIEQLISAKSLDNPRFGSDNDWLIEIYGGMYIYNDRS